MGELKFALFALLFQAVLILLLGLFVEYKTDVVWEEKCQGLNQATCEDASHKEMGCLWSTEDNTCHGGESDNNVYPFFQDVHVMIFIGFGFLMTFLKRYGFSAVGFTYFLAAIVIQWSILTDGFWFKALTNNLDEKIKIHVESLVDADFACATVLISFGALVGKASPMQLLFIAFFEMIFYSLNYAIGMTQYKVADVGGSITLHSFGACFGLAATMMLSPRKKTKASALNGSNHTSDLFAMIGTVFLFMFWPSFNAALADGAGQQRAVLATIFSITASVAAGFGFSALFRPEHKFSMVDIQNATIAGGVAVGAVADLLVNTWSAGLIGFGAGFVSVFGYVYILPFMNARFGLFDTCGILNLHAMPGIMGGLISAIVAGRSDETEYGQDIGEIFAARKDGARSASEQAGFQLAFLFTTIGISVASGLVIGWFASLPYFNPPVVVFEDKEHWMVESDDEEEHHVHHHHGAHGDVIPLSEMGSDNKSRISVRVDSI